MYDEEWEPEFTGPQGLGLLGGAVALLLGVLLPQATYNRGALQYSISVLGDRGWIAIGGPFLIALLGVGAIAQQWGLFSWLTSRVTGIVAGVVLAATLALWWPAFSLARNLSAYDGIGIFTFDYRVGLFFIPVGMVATIAALIAPSIRDWVDD